ncbi:MAG: hypothetical protein WBL88_02590 [Nitrososphaeraceae archaeon]
MSVVDVLIVVVVVVVAAAVPSSMVAAVFANIYVMKVSTTDLLLS